MPAGQQALATRPRPFCKGEGLEGTVDQGGGVPYLEIRLGIRRLREEDGARQPIASKRDDENEGRNRLIERGREGRERRENMISEM